jgi:LysM repeat protein
MDHIFLHGETLSSIAHRYGVTVSAIMHANRLHTDLIYPGQSSPPSAASNKSSEAIISILV